MAGSERKPAAPQALPRHPWAHFHETAPKAADSRAAIRRLWGYLRVERAVLVATAVLVAASSLLGLAGPYLMARAIDSIATGSGDLPLVCALMAAAYGVASLLIWAQGYLMAGAALRTVRRIRYDLFARMQRLPVATFDRRQQGDTMSRVTNDVDNISMVLSDSVSQIVSGILSLVGVAAAMLLMNWRLALVAMGATIASSVLMTGWVAKRTRAGFRDQQAALGDLNAYVEETVSGQRAVIAHYRQQEAVERFHVANEALRRAATRAQMYSGAIGPLMNLSGNLNLAVVATVGGVMAAQGTATVGLVAGFVGYSRHFARPLTEIAALYNAFQAALAGAERVFELMDEAPEADDADALTLEGVRGEVALENVCFGYEPGVPVLSDVSLRAEPGQVVALIGPTGAGKTTVINLLSRFYDVDHGAIRLDGTDIRRFRREDLRQRLGIVLQDTFLFAGTVRDNIRYGRLDATDDEIVAAARLAEADAFICRLPHGYDTLLSERAENLSRGQRQLLAIARAALADHAILILDEATSSVDTRTERQIQQAMRRLMAGRTCFVIAHRLSTIRDADLIMVIDGGRIVEQGRHAELLALRGFYWRMVTGRYQGEFSAQEGVAEPEPASAEPA
ncbi:MAG TPA: ABC transporter ATP-binding protein [Chthonomonadales bacterium]|nr:ABC transporter ATP-binding protein [Chthonomonadales bacterium]